jgi:hypothetical protein
MPPTSELNFGNLACEQLMQPTTRTIRNSIAGFFQGFYCTRMRTMVLFSQSDFFLQFMRDSVIRNAIIAHVSKRFNLLYKFI